MFDSLPNRRLSVLLEGRRCPLQARAQAIGNVLTLYKALLSSRLGGNWQFLMDAITGCQDSRALLATI